SGTENTQVTNYGYVEGDEVGVYFDSPNSSLVTEGGLISGNDDSVYLRDSGSSVTIVGRTNMIGTIQNSNSANGNVLNFNLIMSPGQAAALRTEIANAGPNFGTFTQGGITY